MATLPKKKDATPPDIQELAKSYAKEAIETAVEIMRDAEAKPGIRIKACKLILDRGFGKVGNAPETEPEGKRQTVQIVSMSDSDLSLIHI